MFFTAVEKMTAALIPPHTHLPWITVNGEHNINHELKIVNNLVKWACENYKGDIKL